jgi:hypothetical protein
MSDRTERASHLAGCVLAYVYITSGNRLPEPGQGAGSTAYVGQKPYQTVVVNMGSKRLVVMVTDKEDGRLNLENPLLSVEVFDIDFDDLDDLDDLDEPVTIEGESVYRVHAFEDGVWVQTLLNYMRAAIGESPAYLH